MGHRHGSSRYTSKIPLFPQYEYILKNQIAFRISLMLSKELRRMLPSFVIHIMTIFLPDFFFFFSFFSFVTVPFLAISHQARPSRIVQDIVSDY